MGRTSSVGREPCQLETVWSDPLKTAMIVPLASL
jgi:hypothetical protein